MAVMLLAPPKLAPMATSAATFSLHAHSEYISSYCLEITSVTSVLGVPGYDDTTVTPASYAPLATASFPSISFFIGITFLIINI